MFGFCTDCNEEWYQNISHLMKETESVCEILWFENKWNNGNYPICQSKFAGERESVSETLWSEELRRWTVSKVSVKTIVMHLRQTPSHLPNSLCF
jgi:hypothetical protein